MFIPFIPIFTYHTLVVTILVGFCRDPEEETRGRKINGIETNRKSIPRTLAFYG